MDRPLMLPHQRFHPLPPRASLPVLVVTNIRGRGGDAL